MATLDASQAVNGFSGDVGYSTTQANTPTDFNWRTLDVSPEVGDTIVASGTGFTYAGLLPTGGTATQVIDFGTDGVADWTLTGISAALTDLINASDYNDSSVGFWEATLAGNDTIIAPLLKGGQLFGDFTSVVVEPGSFGDISRTGGNDTFTASSQASAGLLGTRGSVAGNALVGDALYAQGEVATINGFPVAIGATVIGGNDTFNVSGRAFFEVVGDVQWAGPVSFIAGGDDVVNSSYDNMTIFTFGGGFYAGDVELNQGTVDGGNDTIRGSNFPFVNEILAGDVHTNAAEGFLTGGDDALFGRAGQDLLSGDVYRMKGGAVTGGADVIQGGEDSDIIAGDLLVMADPSTPVQINFTGGADRLFGDNGNDWIAGDIWDATGIAAGSTVKGGNDTLSGGAGDDTLLGDFGGSAGLAAQGGDDVLDGGAGADRLEGGAGNDTYINPTGDTIVEAFQPGIDTVKSDVSFSLAAIANVERLVLTGTAAINGNGNGLDNLITGNGAANTLRGLAGNDTLAGGAGADRLEGSIGDDTYVDPAGDTIVELAHQGIDTVQTAANFSLAAIAEVERLVLTGSADVNGTGNALANAITGNAGANALNGAAGNDTLTGGGGNDTLTGGGNDDLLNGGAGADLFRFSAASSGTDTIQGFSKTADHFDLGGAVFTAVSDITGDSVLTYSGGTIIVQAVAGLTLAQWNDLIIP